jgi:hypothetical protein
VDQNGAGGQSSPEREPTGIPMHRTSPWQHGKQEKGMGIPTPVGMRRQRGLDGWASMKGEGSQVSSMRRCSTRGGEGRRRATSVVWRGGDGGAFYRATVVRQGEKTTVAGGVLLTHRLLEGEATGQRRFKGEMKRS